MNPKQRPAPKPSAPNSAFELMGGAALTSTDPGERLEGEKLGALRVG